MSFLKDFVARLIGVIPHLRSIEFIDNGKNVLEISAGFFASPSAVFYKCFNGKCFHKRLR